MAKGRVPTRDELLAFIKESSTPVGKREIARAWGIKGDQRIELKALLRDLRDTGEIAADRGWDLRDVSRAALRGAAARFSDPEDARFMLERFLQPQTAPVTEPSTASLAPVSETSSTRQLRRQVPSMPIICAAKPRSKTTRSPLRRSVAMACVSPS